MATYVLSVLGEDRSGLVEALSGVVTGHDGNWERSHMTHLAGKFAGVVMVTVPERKAEAFLHDLTPLREQGLLDISVEPGRPVEIPGRAVTLELIGNDHPGIVHQLSHLLTTRGVTIDDLRTWTSEAPMDGARLFHAAAVLRLPDDLTDERLVGELEDLAVDLMVDIDVEEAPGSGS